MIDSMRVSVVIPAYNEEKYIKNCLESLKNQIDSPDEIIVVDNNCTDKTVEIAKKYGAKIVKETIQGMIPARNKGFDSAQFEIIARTDADARAPKNWIKLIKENYAKYKDLVGLSGPAHFYDFPFPNIFQYSQWQNKLIFKFIKSQIKHDTLYGPNMTIKKTAWEKIKNEVCLDDKSVHEDTDLAIHLGKIGNIKIDSRLVISTSFRRFRKPLVYYEYIHRLFKTFGKHNFSKSILPHHKKSFVHDIGSIDVLWKEFAPIKTKFPDTAIIYLPGWSLHPSSKPVEKLCNKLSEKLGTKTFAIHTRPEKIADNSLFHEAHAIQNLLQEINPSIRQIILVTHSQGAVKTIHLAHLLQEDLNCEIKGIICITPVGLYKMGKLELQIKFLGESIKGIIDSFKEIWQKDKSTTNLVSSVISYVKDEINKHKLPFYNKKLRQQTHELVNSSEEILKKLSGIKSKIAFILAEKDLISSPSIIKALLEKSNLQHIRVSEKPNTHHGLPYVQTEILVDEIAELIRKW